MYSLLNLISNIIQLYIYVIIAGALLSWLVAFNVVNTSNRFIYNLSYALYRLTEPALRPIRRFLPDMGGLDISPVILILGLVFLRSLMWEMALGR